MPKTLHLDWIRLKALLIIDEAQNSYSCKSLWNDFIKSITPRDTPMVILLSSWGSATSRSEAQSTTPIILTDEQRISIRPTRDSDPSVFFTYSEYLDVVERIKANKAQFDQKFLPDSDVVDYVWQITNGHPSGVQATFEFLASTTVSITLDFRILSSFAYWFPLLRSYATSGKEVHSSPSPQH